MRVKRTQMARLVLVLAFLATDLHAEADARSSSDDFYNLSLAELGQMEISIATGNSTPLDRAPATASVISAAEIQAMGARNLNEVLETVPGLHVSLSSLSRLDSVYSIRGIHTGFNPQVLFLLNGIPLQYSLQGGRPTLFRMPVMNIARVEVIRGPGSAVYGADAYAGVVNIITKDAASMAGAELGARSGSFGSRDLWAQAATEWSDVAIGFGMSYQETDGDPDRVISSDLQTALDQNLGTNASLAPASIATRYELLDTHLSLSTGQTQINLWSWISRDAGVGAGGAQVLDPLGSDDSKLVMLDIGHQLQGPFEWDNSFRLSHLYYDIQTIFRLFPPDAMLPISDEGNVDFVDFEGMVNFPDGLFGNPGGRMGDTRLEWVSLYTGLDAHRFRIAVGARRQTLDPRETKNFGPGVIDGRDPLVDGALVDVSDTPFVYLADSERNLRYLSLQDEWQMTTDLALTAGLRYDDYSDFGGTTNPRIALVWTANEKFTTKLLYGSAFRAPSFAELYFKNNPVSLGNTSLKPERIDTQELSFNFLATQTLQTSITFFTYKATDMIEFMPDERTTTKTAQNALDQNGRGIEWEANWKPSPQLQIGGSFAWQDAENARTEARIADAPQHQFKMNANWEIASRWHLNSQLNWVGDRARSVGDVRPAIADYTLLNFTLHREQLLPDLDLSFAVRNATDEDAREPSNGSIPDDYPLESRSMWFGLTYTFR